MRVLITGATGFIGSNACKTFHNLGHTVAALTRSPAEIVGADIALEADGSYESILAAMKNVQPDVVIHLAAFFVKDHTPQDIPRLITSNITYGCLVMEAATEAGCRRFVSAGTAWQHSHVTDTRYSPANLYAATKQAFEDLARWYAKAHGISVTALLFGDTYGPGDPRPKLFSLLRDAVQTGEPLRLSPGGQRLDPLYVLDAVNALLVAAQRDEPGFAVFRVSPGHPVTLKDLVSLWCDANGVAPDLRWGALPYRQHEVMEPWCGGTPLPGWHATTSLRDGFAAMASCSP